MLLKYFERTKRDQDLGFINQPELGPSLGAQQVFIEELGDNDIVEFNGQIPLRDISTYDLSADEFTYVDNHTLIRFSKSFLDGQLFYINNSLTDTIEIFQTLSKYQLAGSTILPESFTTNHTDVDIDWSFDGLFLYVTEFDPFPFIKLVQFSVDTGAGGLPYRFNQPLVEDGDFQSTLGPQALLKIDVADDGLTWFSVGPVGSNVELVQYSNLSKDVIIGSSIVHRVILPAMFGPTTVTGIKITGKHFLIFDITLDQIHSFPMSVKNDITSIDFSKGKLIDVNAIDNSGFGMDTNQNGTEIFLNGTANKTIIKFDAPTVQEPVEVVQ